MPNEKNRKSTHDKNTNGVLGIFMSALKSALISLVLSTILSITASALLLFYADPTSLVLPLSLAVLYLSSFAAGYICIKKVNEGALLCGITSGAMLWLFYSFLTLFFPAEISSERGFVTSLLLHSLIILFSVFGAYAARHRSSRKRKLKR